MRETLTPASQSDWLNLRVRDITSTEVSALFDISPYTTSYELWHQKKDAVVVTIEENERMKWGNVLQDAIAHSIAEERGWGVRRMNEYMRIPDLRIGASFDFSIDRAISEVPDNWDGRQILGLLEIKNVDGLIYRDNWLIDGDNVEAPPHIELQVQHQLLISGRDYAYIGALIGGNRLVMIKRIPDVKIQDKIINRVNEFWKSIDLDIEPKPDYTRDADFIARLYGYAEPNKIFDARNDSEIKSLTVEYCDLIKRAKVIEGRKDEIKAHILTKIGDAEKVNGEGFTISAGMVAPTFIEAYERKGYRGFRVFPRKEKS